MKPFTGRTILVVDDEPTLREILADELTEEGAKAFQASNAKEALVVVQEQAIDLIISDIRMQGGDGIELLDQLRKVDPVSPPLIFVTGFSDLSISEAYHKGAESVVHKPFKLNYLLVKVWKSLISPRDRYQNYLLPPSLSQASVGEKKDQKPAFQIQKQFSSIRDASDLKAFRFGRGGFFLAGDYAVKVHELVEFKLIFTSETPSLLEGTGVVRWCRPASVSAEMPQGLGIKIQALSEASRKPVLDYLSQLKEIAFIPNGF